MEFGEPLITFDEIINKIYNIEPQILREKEMFVKGFFMGDGSSGIYKYKSGKKYCWYLNNLDFNLIEKLQRFCRDIWDDIDFKIYGIRESSNIYRISSNKKKLALDNTKRFKQKTSHLLFFNEIPTARVSQGLQNISSGLCYHEKTLVLQKSYTRFNIWHFRAGEV